MNYVKYVLLVPLRFNDGSEVPKEVLLDLQDSFFERFNGWSIQETVEGAYRMQDGKKAVDHSVVYWIVIAEDQYEELREIVSELGRKLGQESMYLEKTGSTIDFVEPAPEGRTGEKP